jgi:ketosteroid isomerase-like protein
MTRDETQRFFDRRVAAWYRRDVDALMRAHTDDCVLESPLAGKVTGRPAIENVYRAFTTSFPDVTIENPELVVDGDRVVQTVTFSGTNRADSWAWRPRESASASRPSSYARCGTGRSRTKGASTTSPAFSWKSAC